MLFDRSSFAFLLCSLLCGAHATLAGAQPPVAPWLSCVQGGQARLVLGDSTMTLDVRACRLADVLELIGARSGIAVTTAEELSQRRISTLLEAQPIESALRQLLHDTDAFFLYRTDGRISRLAAVWVYPAGGAQDVAPVPRELWASVHEFETQLTDQDPEARGRAVEELIRRKGEAAMTRALDALMAPDAHVRQRALDAALEAELDVPIEQLEHLATSDASPEVRLRALQALEQRPGTIRTPMSAARHETSWRA